MNFLRSLLCVLVLACTAAAAPAARAAVPSIHDVFTAASTGHLGQARKEVDQVLAVYPNSAKAHYVSARVAALQGNWPMAASELATAQRLDPGLGFEHRDTLQAFTRQVAAHTSRATAPPARRGLPLGAIGIGLAVVALLILWAVYRASRRPQVQVVPPAWPGTSGQAPYPGYPQQPAGPAQYGGYPPGAYPPGAQRGSGIMGAVGTGLAVGAGVAAGEMLVDKLFDRGGANAAGLDAGAAPLPPMADAAPLPDDQDFGIDDASSWTDDGGSDTWS